VPGLRVEKKNDSALEENSIKKGKRTDEDKGGLRGEDLRGSDAPALDRGALIEKETLHLFGKIARKFLLN